jgi:cholesterol transport system auxiliary component
MGYELKGKVMRKLAIVLMLAAASSGCVSINGNKSAGAPAIYDFGYVGEAAKVPVAVAVEPVTATPSLRSNRIRYRLAYDDPEHVRAYADSRWAAMPAELLTQKLRSVEEPTALRGGCMLKLQLELFDQIFESKTASNAVVVLTANLVKKDRSLIAVRQFRATEPAATADARGGVAALSKAGNRAITEALTWAGSSAVQSSSCPQ